MNKYTGELQIREIKKGEQSRRDKPDPTRLLEIEYRNKVTQIRPESNRH